MKNKNESLAGFLILVDIIRSGGELTPEQKESWKEYVQRIEDMDTIKSESKVPKKYLKFKKDEEFADVKPWWKRLLWFL